MSKAAGRTQRHRDARRREPVGLRCVHRMFEEQARRAPGAVALAHRGESTTYGELDAMADRVARRLRSLGAGPETLVGVLLGRSPALVAALLGVLKAGAAYVPLDPTYPRDRLAYLLEDSRAPILLTERGLFDRLGPHSSKVVLMEDDDQAPEGDPINLEGATLDNLAYVIYTSGSTGKPKGAMITHRGLANYLAWAVRAYKVSEGRGSPVHSSISFDLTVTSLLAPLVAGRRVDLLDEDMGVEQLTEALRRSRDYSLVKITPAHLKWIGDQVEPGEAPGRTRAFVIGGEQLTAEHVAFWRRWAPETTLINEYGPTETVVGCCVYRVPPVGPIGGPIPIGRPIANTRLYVADRHLQPVPVGVPGELFIGGLGVARGYLDRPALTAEKFIPDPFGEVPGGRLYRTGDLVRWRGDGQLEYVGRVDHQIKIRGHRIEPGEVEAALSSHPAIREAVVVARDDRSGELGLVAYLTTDPASSTPSTVELRRFLGNTLPEPMVPSTFVVLETLPLTPNGKVDRDALPAPEGSTLPAPGGEFVPPRGPLEEVIAGAWASVLGRDRVGAFDNFFDLGGHSLLATQVMSRVRDACGVEIPLRALFECPTVAGLAGRIEAIRGLGGSRDATPIGPSARAGPQSPSFAQEALWLLHQLAPDRPTFNVTAAVGVSGPLDVPALGRAVNELARRHESLRTTFEAVDGRPVMLVAPALELPLDVVDLTDRPSEDRQPEAGRLAMEEARRPFDLGRGPLARVVVLRLGESEHAVLLAMHHIMTDGWSFGVAAGELSALYQAYRRGLPSPLPDPPIQYADFARWQRDQRQRPAWLGQIEAWRRRLAGVPALELPTDHPRPPIRSMRGALRPFSLATGLSDAVRELSRRAGVTPFMTLLAAFQVVLSRWSGQDDFAVGSPVANRTRAETEGLIGYFVNMLALRADLAGDPSTLDLLARVREVSLEAFEHQEIPLEVVIEALAPRRESSRTPLFQVMFVLQNNAMPATGALDLSLSPLDLPQAGTGTAKFELALGFADTPSGFLGSLEYSVDLFDEATIDRLARHYETVLGGMVADPEGRLSRLSLLSEDERRLVAEEWSGSGELLAGSPPVHERFEALARRTPDEPALVAGDERWTYAELNARANRLARHLIALGVGPEVRVALALSRPSSRLSSLLGVLKAGGAYVPLDPSTPLERLRGMLVDARVSVAITESGGLSGLGGLDGSSPDLGIPLAPSPLAGEGARGSLRSPGIAGLVGTIVDLDLESTKADLAARGAEDPEVSLDGSNLAYVIFTSGSTGRPKGVEVAHASLAVATTAWAGAYALRGTPMPHLQAAPFAFDVYTGDWARALGTGGALVACPRETLIDPPALVDLMRRERVGCAELVPAVAEALAGELERRGGGLPDLRLLAVGSDTLRSGLYGRLRRRLGPSCRVVNSYGLTEATIDSSFHEGPCPEADDRPVPIGRPFPGTRLYILDREMRPSPPGVAGELYVGGSGVARGYSSDPRRTASRFVPDPFDEAGGRIYRTGDRARWAAGGVVELLGRLDGQVKVRGHRVELGEVEAALLKHEAVREAVVVATPADADGVRLVAYVAGHPGRLVPAEAVRRSLRDRLPRPMIPSRFVALKALPRTSAGKVDRDALPPPSGSRDDGFIPPRDDVERRVAAIWEGLLGVRPLGSGDDFFDLGGHSLLAVRLASRIEEEFGRSLPLSTLFLSTTVEGLAERLRAPAVERARSPLIEFGTSGQVASLAMVHPVGGGVLCYGPLARSLDGALGVLGLQAAGLEGDGEPENDLTRMAARYVEALVEAQPEGPYRLGGWSLGGVVAFEMARQLEAKGLEVALLALIDSTSPGPARGPSVLDEFESMATFAADLVRSSGRDAAPWIDRLRTGDLAAFEAGGFDPSAFDPELLAEVGPDRLRRHYEVFRANRRALAAYDPAPYRGRAVRIVAEASEDSTQGWDVLVQGGLTTYTLPGDHYSILQKPSVGEVAAIVARESGATRGVSR